MCFRLTLISACVIRRLIGLCFTVAALVSTSAGRGLITTTGSLGELNISSNFSVRDTTDAHTYRKHLIHIPDQYSGPSSDQITEDQTQSPTASENTHIPCV